MGIKVVHTDENGNHIEVTERHNGFSVMIDNLGAPGVTPENHQFAAVWVPRDKRNDFVKLFADAMGTPVKFADVPPRPAPAEVEPIVTIWRNEDHPDERYRFSISGDITDGLTAAEYARVEEKWRALGIDDGGWTPNYWIVNLWKNDVPAMFYDKLHYDPEGSCFFAYTNDGWYAEQLANYINLKIFLR